jgi:hypothetical protein
MNALSFEFGSFVIQLGNVLESFFESRLILDFGMKPIPAAVRLKPGFLLKNSPPSRERCP